MRIRCPHCQNPIEVVDGNPLADVSCPSCGSNFNLISGETDSHTPGEVRTIGHFELLESVGGGHFGTVWKARDTKLDRTVAVKIPRRGEIEGPEAEMFIREARAAAQVKHPGVVGVYEVGRDDGTLYIVSDFVDGCNLKEWLSGRQLTPREAAELCKIIAEALHVAHEAGVVHRDLKPGNVMMDVAGGPHLTDFGLAKREAGEISMTVDGQLLGTPAYMPPEQARGAAHTADRRSDVYSLGVILFELLTGELPFRGNQRMMIVQILQDEPPSPRKLQSRVPRDLETICLKCLEKAPAKRYQTAAELAAEFARFLRAEPIVARPIGRHERLGRWCKRQPVVAGLSAAAALLIVLVALVSTAGYLSTSRAFYRVEDAQRKRALAQVDTLRTAEISRVPDLIEGLKPFRAEIVPQLRESLQQPELNEKERLRLSLAMVADDDGQVAYLRDRLLTAKPAELLVIRAALLPYRGTLLAGMWRTAEDSAAAKDRRFRAVCALAAFDAESPRWKDAGKPAAEALVAENPLDAVAWVEALRPVRQSLVPALQAVFHDHQRGDAERTLAAGILADYVGDRPDALADLLADADPKQFAMLLPALARLGDKAPAAVQRVLARDCVAAAGQIAINPSWPPPPREAVREVESADGIFTDRWAFCQTMPLERFAPTAESLRAAGYRPSWFQPYVVGKTARIAAVWNRSNRAWKLVPVASDAELLRLDKQFRAHRQFPTYLLHWSDGYGSGAKYLAEWASPGEDPRVASGAEMTIGPGPGQVGKLTPSWTLRFYRWRSAGPKQPPDDWQAVVNSKILHEQKASPLSFLWGQGQPDPAVPAKFFAVVATAEMEMDAGTYYVLAGAPGGIRVFVDDKKVLDKWFAHPVALDRAEFRVSSGKHRLRVEHYHDYGDGCLFAGIVPEELVLVDGGKEKPNPHAVYAPAPALPSANVKAFRELYLPLGYRPAPMSLQSREEGEQPAISLHCIVPAPFGDGAALRAATDAVGLMRLGHAEQVWSLLRHSPDPSVRSHLIHRLGPLGADPLDIVRRLEEESNVSARRALLLCLGEFGPDRLPVADRDALAPKLLGMYRDDPDPGIHGAAEWLLRYWQQQEKIHPIDQQLATGQVASHLLGPASAVPGSAASESAEPAKDGDAKQWYINGQGQTMVILPGPVEFMMGSPEDEKDRQPDETLHGQRIARSFAIASKQVTVAQFRQFMPGFAHDRMNFSPEPDCPILGVCWYEAAAYCNWLSRQEGIAKDQWCYLPNELGEYAEGMKLAAGWSKRTGYRLPSEAEWEYACRAGAVTSRYYGRTEDLLDKYAAYISTTKNERTLPVASLKPNDFGLFDMLGDVSQLCQDRRDLYTTNAGAIGDDRAIEESVTDKDERVVRGAAFFDFPSVLRCAVRVGLQSMRCSLHSGFRVARTHRRFALPGNPIRLEGTALDGAKFDWPAYRGKVVLVGFWDLASEACRLELRHAKLLSRIYQGRGFEVVGISMDRDREALSKFLQKERVPWATLRDEGAHGQHPMAAYYGVLQTPTMLVVDKQGKVASLQVFGGELDRLLDRLLGPACLPIGPLTSIDLQPQANIKLTETSEDNEPPNNLAELPQGEQVLAGVKFTIGKRLIQLDEKNLPEKLRKGKAKAIPIDKKFTRLYILHGAQWASEEYGVGDGAPIGKYRVHYEDGTEAAIPIVLGEDVRDWWNEDCSKTVTRGIVAWVGQNAAVRQNSVGLRLYLAAWDNPHPEKKVVSIDFLRDGPSEAGPFCVAMTVEEPEAGKTR